MAEPQKPVRTCLLVEDSSAMRQLLGFALGRVKGLRVVEAGDGVEGIRALSTGRFDLIITDINMPVMDGLKLVQHVRSDPKHKGTPIVVITTDGAQEDRAKAMDLGVDAYITKPANAPEVIDTVKRLLGIT